MPGAASTAAKSGLGKTLDFSKLGKTINLSNEVGVAITGCKAVSWHIGERLAGKMVPVFAAIGSTPGWRRGYYYVPTLNAVAEKLAGRQLQVLSVHGFGRGGWRTSIKMYPQVGCLKLAEFTFDN